MRDPWRSQYQRLMVFDAGDATVLLTLHHPSMVGRKPQAILRNVNMHFVGEVDRLEQLVQRPGGAGDRTEKGRRRRGALCFHGDAVGVRCFGGKGW